MRKHFDRKLIFTRDVQEYDHVRVGGWTSNYTHEPGTKERVHVEISGIVGSAHFTPENPRLFKVWPDTGEYDPSACGKVWFAEEDVDWIELLDRETDE